MLYQRHVGNPTVQIACERGATGARAWSKSGLLCLALAAALVGAEARAGSSAEAGARPPSTSGSQVAVEQHNVARFVASKYRLALDDVQEFVAHAYQAAREFRLDPLLVLAIVSIESSFNPNARSPKGAQGLMQILTRVHTDKFAPFGGAKAAFDPLANLKVGSQILKDYLVREGSIERALKSYVGAALLPHDYGYGRKVLSEREKLAKAAVAPVDPAKTMRASARTPGAEPDKGESGGVVKVVKEGPGQASGDGDKQSDAGTANVSKEPTARLVKANEAARADAGSQPEAASALDGASAAKPPAADEEPAAATDAQTSGARTAGRPARIASTSASLGKAEGVSLASTETSDLTVVQPSASEGERSVTRLVRNTFDDLPEL